MSADASWDATLYANYTAHHRAYDDNILTPLQIKEDFRVLDLGSGAGDLTSKLADRVPSGSVLGVDASLPLIEASRERFSSEKNVAFTQLRAQQLDEIKSVQLASGGRSGPPFDLVVSVATLHWVPATDHRAVYRSIFDLLVPGATFRADFGGAGQIGAVREVLDEESTALGGASSPWYFPDADIVRQDLEATGYLVGDGFVRLITQRRSVPDATAMIGWLDSQVLIAYQPSLDDAQYEIFRERSIERLLSRGPRDDGTFDQDYIRVDLLVSKPSA